MTKSDPIDFANLRSPHHVMRLSQMGSMFPTRLSFMRTLVRRMIADKSTVTRQHWDMNAQGYGAAVFSIDIGGQTYSLFAISQALDPEMRTDRVIAQAWDAAFVLYDGVPNAAEIARLSAQAPLQEKGRFTERDLCLSRANKSVRLFDAVANALRHNIDLPMGLILNTGYLMRTTAVYGNGKFGIADRAVVETRPGLEGPFMAEMLTVWMIRHFTTQLVEHVGGAELNPRVKRFFGIGNSTGLGMAPFLVSHPLLLHSWMASRETALAQVRAAVLTHDQVQDLLRLRRRVAQHLLEWNVPDEGAQSDIIALRKDWAALTRSLSPDDLVADGAVDRLIGDAAQVSSGLEELTIAWALEGYGPEINVLTDCMANPFAPQLDGAMSCGDVARAIEAHWPECIATDFEVPFETEQFWYVSESKLEPRIGNRTTDEGATLESPLDIARKMRAFYDDVSAADGQLWTLLIKHPHHRLAALRVQALMANPYSEIRDNLIAGDVAPIDMLRCKLSFFGATKFDPKSKLWTRIALAQGAPLAQDLADGSAKDDWWLPVFAP